MLQFLALTQAGCRRSFPRRLLDKLATPAMLAVVALSSQVVYAQAACAESSGPPNIVFIMADDMGYGDVGCYNPDSKIPTPHIDRLAREGVRFTDAHAPAAVCVPTRYGLLTGRYPFRMTGRRDNVPLIAPDRLTIGKLLQRRGYDTACIGKWHLGFDVDDLADVHQGGPVDRGFHDYFGIPRSLDIPPYYYIRNERAVEPPTGRVAASSSPNVTRIQGAFWRAGGIAPGFKHVEVLPKFADEAVAYLDDPARTKTPFFLYFALPAPHTPWLPTKEFQGKTPIGDYGDFTAQVDHVIGRVLAALDRNKLTDNTLVIVTSDNGPVWYRHDVEKHNHDCVGGLRGMKGDAYEGGHRMPFVARWPGQIKPGSVSNELICHTDMLATFAAIVETDLPAGEGLDSRSILPVLRGEPRKKPVHDSLILQSSRGYLAVRKGPWKLIPGLGSGGFTKPSRVKPEPGGPKGQLYHLGKDRGETKNVWLDHPDKVAELTAVLERERKRGSR